MEHLVRIVNETDRQVLAWLRAQVGDARVERAARQLGHTRKPFPSAVCRYLGMSAPATLRPAAARPRAARDFSVGDRYLSLIRQHLATHSVGR
ncbi:hypothetical protein QZM97_15165 [Burkholderia orbicola]|jgi:hypothetical protein|uniref:Uncharacterized protein n=3 Tax=Burkholderia cepacia complex TaxID=87882 RepID=A0A3R9D3Z8_9BURK|nr:MULTISPECIES: hypothetical protein [Burkholderia]EKS9842648.1 hypothetical protein [Burkholderia cepacia]BEV49206.1 hypothetical protein BconGalA64_17050 [Burkholderia contaminans]ABK10887.1 conserved hypothetical protein [Burkholderia cenocepacia HI2424]AOJ18781.1 hypothetical protein WJ11_05060 [Burkholderia cenocepacia]AQQ35168.1 hypothetical protein A8E96_23765 [Burkholderia cenocepacia]